MTKTFKPDQPSYYDPVLVSVIRRVVPSLIAQDIVGVQPMGSLAAWAEIFEPLLQRFEYQKRSEGR